MSRGQDKEQRLEADSKLLCQRYFNTSRVQDIINFNNVPKDSFDD